LALFEQGQRALAALGLVLAAGFGLGLAALLVFADLANDVAEQSTTAFDLLVLQTLRRQATPTLDAVASALSWLGAEGLAVVVVLTVLLLAWQRRLGGIVALLLIVLGAQALNSVLKTLFKRPLAILTALPGQAWSFPSGHAMVSLATYGFLAYLGWRLLSGGWRWLWIVALALLILLVGLSRLYLGVHYATDVLAGYLTGFIWLDSVIIGGQLLQRRAVRRNGRPANELHREPGRPASPPALQ
jgi:membrane-associated phospholipid phosphatase